MKTKITILMLLAACFTFPAFSQGTLRVEVSNVKEAKGTVNVGLFATEDTFLKKPTFGKIVKADKEKVIAVFENLPNGTYAISVIHDENENGELDTNFMGIPKEGFGFGNDASGMFGPPSFEKASIHWDGKDKQVSVKLKYL